MDLPFRFRIGFDLPAAPAWALYVTTSLGPGTLGRTGSPFGFGSGALLVVLLQDSTSIRCGTLRNHPHRAAVDEFNRFAAGTLTGSVAGGGERHSFCDFWVS